MFIIGDGSAAKEYDKVLKDIEVFIAETRNQFENLLSLIRSQINLNSGKKI